MNIQLIRVTISFLIATSCLADTTWFAGDEIDVEGIWDVNESPYIVTRGTHINIREQTSLTISSGVDVLIDYDGVISNYGGSLIVNGTADDSVNFGPVRNATSAIIYSDLRSSHTEFNFCKFTRFNSEDNGDDCSIAIFSDIIGFTMRNCTINESVGGLWLQANGIVEDCLFQNTKYTLEVNHPAQFKRCTVMGSESMIEAIIGNGFTIEYMNCLFNDYNSMVLVGEVKVRNSLFIDSRRCYLYRNRDIGAEGELIGYNCFHGDPEIPFGVSRNRPDTLSQLGIINSVNSNGDSCDAYGNIFLDPRIVEGWEWGDEEFLLEDSPCIDAGDPDTPLDPDSTIADIGPFFFSQPNIAVSADSLTFEETLVGEVDTVFFSIRNRGNQKTLLYFIEEDSLAFVFFVDGWLGDTAGVEPGETVEFGLIFQPDSAREYLDTLRIVSNDRDESVIEISVQAFGASSVWGDEEVGRVRSPVLLSVSPNPFNSTLTIRYAGGLETAATRLTIHDINGREVYSAVTAPSVTGNNGNAVTRGGMTAENVLTWDAFAVPAGIYLVRLQAGAEVMTRKVVLVR